VDALRFRGEEAEDNRGQGTDRGRGTSGGSGRGADVGGREDRGRDTVSNSLLVLSNGNVKDRDARGRGRGAKVQGFLVNVRRITVVGVIRHLAAVSTMRDCPSVRNSLPTRSSLDGGGKTWVLKAEICGGYDESDEEGDDDGLDRQRYEVLSIP